MHNYLYIKELEFLILDTLLPSYISHQKSLGNKNPLEGINTSILKQIRAKRELPALLRPYK